VGIWYARREDVKRALDVAETARSNGQIDRAIESASRSVEGLTKRKFYPQTATRYFDWPDRRRSRTYRLWLDGDELITVDTLTAGGVTIASTDYFLEPANSGPPYTHIEIDLASSAVFQSDDTHQRAIAVTGLFGHSADEQQVGVLSAELAADEDASAAATFTEHIGVGDILRIDDERMIVTRKTMVDSTQNIGGNLTAAKNNETVPVTDGTAFIEDMIILVDAERMLVVDIAGNNLIVKRAWDGSTLAAHTSGADIYTLTGVELDRAAVGTTLAVHTNTTAIYRHLVPALVRELCIAEALNTIEQEKSSYGRTIGTGESERLVGGRGLSDIRAEVRTKFGRKARTGAV
jgi:hypothetical protein